MAINIKVGTLSTQTAPHARDEDVVLGSDSVSVLSAVVASGAYVLDDSRGLGRRFDGIGGLSAGVSLMVSLSSVHVLLILGRMW